MDFNDYWQENKRFVLTVLAALILFWIGNEVINSSVGDELARSRVSKTVAQKKLREERYSQADKTRAEEQNGALLQAVGSLSEAAAFRTRPEFLIQQGQAAGSAYFARVSEVRERLTRRAGRENMRLPADLGLPALAPTRDDEIVRHLEALDLIERVLVLCLEAEVERVDKISIKLDPKLYSRSGVGRIERTEVSFRLSGDSAPIVRLLNMTQSPEYGDSLLVDSLSMVPERNKQDEARLEVTFLIARLTKSTEEVEG